MLSACQSSTDDRGRFMTVRLKILVVDDEEAMREVLRERLESFGFEVSTAEDGAAAERRVAAFDPDAVLSDVVLPDTSGLDLLRMIRGAGRDRPVILITAHGTVELAVEAMKGGATDFLTKPVDYERLRALFDGMASTMQDSSPRRRGRRASASWWAPARRCATSSR